MNTNDDLSITALHEAGHAVLQLMSGIGLKEVTIEPNVDEMAAGLAVHFGATPAPGSDAEALLETAEDAYYLRHAVSYYSGAEAVRQNRPYVDADAGADSDYRNAEDAIGRITGDPESAELYLSLAKRRAAVLVELYRPEIKATAEALLQRKTLSGESVRQIVMASLNGRQGGMWSW